MLEAIIVVASVCLTTPMAGSACDASQQSYIKQNKLDTLSQKYGEKIKKKYPSMYLAGVVAGGLYQKKYNASLYGPFGAEVDLSNPNNQLYRLFYKIGF